MAQKRKVDEMSPSFISATFVPKNITSYLCGALSTDFSGLRELIRRQNAFIDKGHSSPEDYLEQILEELFRYLFLISDCSESHEIQLSPSLAVDKVLHSLLLDPVLYHKVCDKILTLRGKSMEDRPIRVLPHNPLGGNNFRERHTRYQNTLVTYVAKFNEDPPEEIWPQDPEHFYHENHQQKCNDGNNGTDAAAVTVSNKYTSSGHEGDDEDEDETSEEEARTLPGDYADSARENGQMG